MIRTVEGRVRKAWLVKVHNSDDGDIVFAPSAGKAAYKFLLDLRDLWPDITFADIRVRRERSADVLLPSPSPIVDDLSQKERECLLHAFGFNRLHPERAGYRNHFCTHPDDPPLVRLADLGLMERTGQGIAGEGLIYFLLTDLGRHVALSMVPEYAR